MNHGLFMFKEKDCLNMFVINRPRVVICYSPNF